MKKIMSLFLFVCVCVMMIGGNTAVYTEELCTPAGIAYDMIGEELDRYVKKYEEGLASCEVAVFDHEGIITSRYYGYSDFENNVPADENMVYDWGSTSKLLVWVSVMEQMLTQFFGCVPLWARAVESMTHVCYLLINS